MPCCVFSESAVELIQIVMNVVAQTFLTEAEDCLSKKRSNPWVQMQQFSEESKTKGEASDSLLLDSG